MGCTDASKPYTVGPWTYEANDKGDGFWVGNDNENACFVPGYTDHPGNIANAKLVSAAPEMLDALQVIIGASEGRIGMKFSDRMELVKAAIAKATA